MQTTKKKVRLGVKRLLIRVKTKKVKMFCFVAFVDGCRLVGGVAQANQSTMFIIYFMPNLRKDMFLL